MAPNPLLCTPSAGACAHIHACTATHSHMQAHGGTAHCHEHHEVRRACVTVWVWQWRHVTRSQKHSLARSRSKHAASCGMRSEEPGEVQDLQTRSTKMLDIDMRCVGHTTLHVFRRVTRDACCWLFLWPLQPVCTAGCGDRDQSR